MRKAEKSQALLKIPPFSGTRRAIEILEKDAKVKESSTTVGVSHMMKIFNDINPMNTASFDRSAMPLLHKILLCTLLLCNREFQMKEILLSKVGKTFSFYRWQRSVNLIIANDFVLT
jgi:hypothetical protein